jgi:hypothetical protein
MTMTIENAPAKSLLDSPDPVRRQSAISLGSVRSGEFYALPNCLDETPLLNGLHKICGGGHEGEYSGIDS